MVAASFEGPVLLPRAASGREELGAELRAAGYQVDLVEAYEAVVDAEALKRAAAQHRDRPFAAIAFTSPRGVTSFLGVLGGVAGLGRALLGAIGETTARALLDAGVSAPLVASRPEVPVLLDQLAGALAARPKME
jgi:uroporphyrinogen-III synthase